MNSIFLSAFLVIVLGGTIEIAAVRTAQHCYILREASGTDPSCQPSGLPMEAACGRGLRLCNLVLDRIREMIPDLYNSQHVVHSTSNDDKIYEVRRYSNSQQEWILGFDCIVQPGHTTFVLKLTPLTPGTDRDAKFNLSAYVPDGPAQPA